MNFDFSQTFRTLQNRNFRLYFIGQILSTVGTFMQAIAMGWLVYRLTNSAFLLGLVGFGSQLPSLILSPFGGVIADRWNRLNTYKVTQIFAMIQAFVLAYITFHQMASVWHLIILGAFLGLVGAIDFPVRQALLIDIVEKKEDLANAIPLNSSIIHVSRFLGPAIAGYLVAVYGEGVCFFVNGVSYFAVLVALFAMKLPKKEIVQKSVSSVFSEIKEGFNYVSKSLAIRSLLLTVAMVSVAGMPYFVLMPIFAKDIFHGSAILLGFLSAVSGIGSLMASFYLASRKSVLGLGRIIVIALSILSVGMIIFAFSKIIVLSMAVIFVMGMATTILLASNNTILQTIVEDDKRGRVMSYYTMAFMGLGPIASLIAGSAAQKIGVSWTVASGGTIMMLAAWLFYRKLPAIRKITYPAYRKMGIIPEISAGLQTTAEMRVPREE